MTLHGLGVGQIGTPTAAQVAAVMHRSDRHPSGMAGWPTAAADARLAAGQTPADCDKLLRDALRGWVQ